MRKLLFRSILVAICIFSISCKKTLESIVNCTGEALLMSVHHNVDTSSPKLVHFEARYSGSHSVESVSWEFGDGKTATGKSLTADHTYDAAGTYNVKAKIKIVSGKSTCEGDPAKSVVIN
jgi:hypothetical protein